MENCPICDSKLVDDNSVFYPRNICKTGCYTLVRTGYSRHEFIFGEEFSTSTEDHSETARKVDNKFKETVKYWKENDRYLIKVMGA
ncbi:MAG: hypothetical protein K0R18_534 [Bacillales bacterium]|jgi:hypothetical protein|nr:hypothetical protein [Bacillales bacterium]